MVAPKARTIARFLPTVLARSLVRFHLGALVVCGTGVLTRIADAVEETMVGSGLVRCSMTRRWPFPAFRMGSRFTTG